MADIVKLRTGYAVSVAIIRTGFSGPPGAGGGSAYDDTAILARVSGVEQSIAALPAPYDDAALAGRVAALEGASVAWVDIADVPTAFTPAAHRHDASQIDNLPVPAWVDITGKPAAFPPSPHRHGWVDLDNVPATFAPAAHVHGIGDVNGLTAALDGKAPAANGWTLESLQDVVAAMFQSGTHSNATVTYDDAAGTISISAAGSGGPTLTQEEVEDFVGSLVIQGTGINVEYDDAGNVLSISLAGESYTAADKNKLAGIAAGATANATDAQLRDRTTHTGQQAISTVTGLQAELDGKQPLTTFKTVNGEVITGSGDIAIPTGADGKGWSGGSYSAATGVVTFDSADGLGFSTGDLRGAAGSSVTVRTYTVLADAQAAQITYPNDIIVLKDP